jgi:AAA domain
MLESIMVKPVGKPEARTTAKQKTKGFSFVTYEEAKTGSASPRWLLKFLLAYNERSGWVGPPGSLKSAILTALAHAVASGQDWCGKRNKGKCAVIYFALERADLVKRRLRAYADEDGLVDLPIVVVGQTINFMDGNVAEEIIATIDEVERRFGIKVGLLIVDTLAKAIAAGGGDENTAKDQGKVYANLDRVKERRSVHVAIACHPGKDASKGPRGSSASTGFKAAKAALHIRSYRVGFSPGAVWLWALPAPPSTPMPEVLSSPASTAPVSDVYADGLSPRDIPASTEALRADAEVATDDASTRRVPFDWVRGEELLQLRPRPLGIPAHRWQIFIEDSRRFLASPWAERAAELGWGTESVFGSRFEPQASLGIYAAARSCKSTKMVRRSWARTEAGVLSIDVPIVR